MIIDYLKMDIEYSEWASLKAMFRQGVLSQVKQLAMEIHLKERFSKQSTQSDFIEYWTILEKLNQIGFVRWDSIENPMTSYISSRTRKKRVYCFNMYFININFL